MFRRFEFVSPLLYLMVMLFVASCGGGGGGEVGGSSDDPAFSLSSSSIAFTVEEGGTPPADQQVTITASGSGNENLFIGVTSGSIFFSSTFTITSSTTGVIKIAPFAPTMAPGTYTDDVIVRGCSAQDCSTGDVAGSPKTIVVTYTVRPRSGITASPLRLTFDQALGAPIPLPQAISITDRNNANYGWTASITYTTGTDWLTLDSSTTTSGAALPASFEVGIVPQVSTGTYVAVIHMTGNGVTTDIPVTYNVPSTLITAIPSSLTFGHATGSPPSAPQTISISDGSSATYPWTASITYTNGSNWLALDNASSTSGSALPTSFEVGIIPETNQNTYRAVIHLTGNGVTTDVPVTYNVSDTLVPSPTSLSFTLTNAPVLADLSHDISPGAAPDVTWAAASDVAWLRLSPASGGSTDLLTSSLVTAETDVMLSGNYTGTITLTPSRGTVQTIPVDLIISRSQITSVTPYTATSNTTGKMIIRGERFNSSTLANVRIGLSIVDSFNVISSTEIHATYSSLLAGTNVVELESSAGILPSTADLLVIDPSIYSGGTIAFPNSTTKTPINLIYDPERRALLVGVGYPSPGSPGELFRYSFSGTTWSTNPTSIFVPNFRDLALSLDGKKLIAASSSDVLEFDPSTLAQSAPPTSIFSPSFLWYLKNIAIANDGNAIISTGINGMGPSPIFRYSINDHQSSVPDIHHFSTPGGSADGSRVLLVQVQGSLAPSSSARQYLAATGNTSVVVLDSNQTAGEVDLDRHATRIVVNGMVYDADYQLLGTVPSTNLPLALSHDGTRAFVWDGTVVRTYDLVEQPIAGSFPELLPAVTPASSPGLNVKMTLTPDNGTLFLAGADRIVVVPLP